jgi:hypothetical protein
VSDRKGPAYLPLLAGLGFGVAGPLVGLACILLAFGLFDTLFQQGPAGTTLRPTPDFGRLRAMLRELLSPLGIQIAYLFGAAPAISTGILAGMLFRRTRSCGTFLLVCAIGGAVLSGICALAIAGNAGIILATALAGAAAALILCGLLWKLAQPSPLPVLEQELS